VIGLVSVVLDDKSKALQFVIKPGFKVEIPKSDYKLEVLKYYPHYGIDKKTKKVQNLSDETVNPAIEVQVQQGKKKFRQWLWSRSSSPHMEYKLPVKVKFSEFNFAAKKGYYELLVASDDKFWLIANDGEKRVIEAAEIDKIYPFADDKYSFKITQIIENSILKDEWHNESDSLNNPALVVSVQDGDQSDRLILQLNSAQQTKGKDGGSVLLFRKKMDMPDGGKK
jgi:hypothetical protein